ncbi:conserved hypothetical protein [Coccidioides posadasii str. Silveira]|uniref:Uncharacterized protein n=1 Tax=Coccidioides posadasii (strain RMSCC 757 / Silveira) TaxID=443226 RepID=E9DF10_COCPS|nr:conserved hypothetical protein [Coccidioides posadasii str. Silveira]
MHVLLRETTDVGARLETVESKYSARSAKHGDKVQRPSCSLRLGRLWASSLFKTLKPGDFNENTFDIAEPTNLSVDGLIQCVAHLLPRSRPPGTFTGAARSMRNAPGATRTCSREL